MKTTYVLLGLALLAGASTIVATPLACTDCAVTASSAGYRAPVVEVANGGKVTWTSTDIAHLQFDTGTHDVCLGFVANGGASSPTVQFNLTGGALTAWFVDPDLGAVEYACGNAVALPDGSHVLAYQCAFHPSMRGAIVVTP